MYAIVINVVRPAMISVLTVVLFSLRLNIIYLISNSKQRLRRAAVCKLKIKISELLQALFPYRKGTFLQIEIYHMF